MTKPRSTSQIIAVAKDALTLLTTSDPDTTTRAVLIDKMVAIIEIATRMDAGPTHRRAKNATESQ